MSARQKNLSGPDSTPLSWSERLLLRALRDDIARGIEHHTGRTGYGHAAMVKELRRVDDAIRRLAIHGGTRIDAQTSFTHAAISWCFTGSHATDLARLLGT